MKKNNQIPITSLFLKTYLIGILFAEFLYISNIFFQRFYSAIDIKFELYKYCICENSYLIIMISYFILLFIPFFNINKKFLKSKRIDLLVIWVLGILTLFIFSDFQFYFFKKLFFSLSLCQLTTIIIIPLLILWLTVIRTRINFHNNIKYKNEADGRKSKFLSDKEIKKIEDDTLGFKDKAKNFAENVFNNGSQDSIVFGIDAPWGSGKSSFVNLCEQYWNEDDKYKNKIIIYKFNPIKYENQDNLLEKFIDGLVKEIKKHVFVPEIKSLFSKYSRFLKKSNASFSFFGFSLEFPFDNESMYDIFKKIENYLQNIDKKIVIIIDDLDRLHFTEIKKVLFSIKKAFMLPNISYILCYDTENINALEQSSADNEKIIEFLEKFINIKIGIYLNKKLLYNFFESNIEYIYANDAGLVEKLKKAVDDIFNSNEFHHYASFFGDVRKVKRLINTISILEIPQKKQETDEAKFNEMDIKSEDLLNLLLIYINYPNIFRKIYYTETHGNRGFFSLVSELDKGYPKDKEAKSKSKNSYKNSIYYKKYIKKLTENQEFILNQIFSEKRLPNTDYGTPNITKKIKTSYACFNGNRYDTSGKNLEEYLNLIINMSRPHKTKQYKFYINVKSDILSASTIREVLLRNDFSNKNGETIHKQLWRVLLDSNSFEFTNEKANEIIYYAANNITRYSFIEINDIGIGFRNILLEYIAVFLDKVGWNDSGGKKIFNNDILEISEWIFGEKRHKNEGILNTLSQEKRGVIGLYDLLSFRLSCDVVRGGNLFNLANSLLKYDNPKAEIGGNTNEIVINEMREISQRVFNIFKAQYIDEEINIFDKIDELELKDVCGNYCDYIKSKIESEEIINKKLSIMKSRMMAFIVYQLENSDKVNCGYYNISKKETKDNYGKIGKEINNYLFNNCFSPEKNENNYKHFLNYLLISFVRTSGGISNKPRYIPNINEFSKVIDKDKLIDYWGKYRKKIKSENYESENKIICTVNYTVSYKDDLESVYKVLDEQLKK